MNILELIGVAALSGAVGAMALAFLCVHFDGSGEPLSLDEQDTAHRGVPDPKFDRKFP